MRPSYGTSKRYLWGSFIGAWGAIYLLLIGALFGSAAAVDLAPMVIPAMLAQIGVMLGLHRHYGSRDFEASTRVPSEPAGAEP